MKKKLIIAALAVILLTLVLCAFSVHRSVVYEKELNVDIFLGVTPLLKCILTIMIVFLETGVFVSIYKIWDYRKRKSSIALPLALLIVCVLSLMLIVPITFDLQPIYELWYLINPQSELPFRLRRLNRFEALAVIVLPALALALELIIIHKDDKSIE